MVPAGVTFDPVVSASQGSLSAHSQRVMQTGACRGCQMLSDCCVHIKNMKPVPAQLQPDSC